MSAALKIFIIYAREDESFKNNLLTAFIPLRRTGKIEVFHDALIKPGDRWEDIILDTLRSAHIILPLVSNDFFASEFIHEVEFKNAVERYNNGETVIMPIVLKPCGWKYDPLIKSLQVLPKDGKPVVTWTYHEEAWEQVLDAVHEVTEVVARKTLEKLELKELEIRRKKEKSEAKKNRAEALKFVNKGDEASNLQEKINCYSKAIELDPKLMVAFNNRGRVKYDLKQFEKAILDFNQAIILDPNSPIVFHNRGKAKSELNQFEKAINDYNQAIMLDATFAVAYNNRGLAKHHLKQFEKAILDFNQAILLDGKFAIAFCNRGMAKHFLKQYEKAIKDFDQGILLDASFTTAYILRGDAKSDLGLYVEAIMDYDRCIHLDSNEAIAFNNRGVSKQNLGLFDAAKKDYLKALGLNPDLEAAKNNLKNLELKMFPKS